MKHDTTRVHIASKCICDPPKVNPSAWAKAWWCGSNAGKQSGPKVATNSNAMTYESLLALRASNARPSGWMKNGRLLKACCGHCDLFLINASRLILRTADDSVQL